MPAPKKPDEEVQQLGAQIIAFDTRLGQCLDLDEYREMLNVENPAEAINKRLRFIAESVKYQVGENDTKPHKLIDILVDKFNDAEESDPLRRVSFEETSSKNETMGEPEDDDWLTSVHAIGVTCGSKGEYPVFKGHSVKSWGNCYFKEHGGMPEYRDGMGVFPDTKAG